MSKAEKRYAKALFELAQEQNKLDAIHKDLLLIQNTIKSNKELQSVLSDPTIATNKKKAIIHKLFGDKTDTLTHKFLDLLEKKERLQILGDIGSAFEDLYKKQKGIVNAQVITAVPLTKDLEQKIYQKIKELTGSKAIQLEQRIDPKIIGGFILNVNDLRYDASIRGKLSKIKSKLVEN